MATGERRSLREWRDASGMSQPQLAAAVGISQQMLSKIEAGKSTPNVTIAYLIADALGVPDRDIIWPESSRYGVGSEPSKAQAGYQQRKREAAALAAASAPDAQQEAPPIPEE